MQSSEKKWPVQSLSKFDVSSEAWKETSFQNGQCCLMIRESQMLIIDYSDKGGTVMESICLFGSGGEVTAQCEQETLGVKILTRNKEVELMKICFADCLEKDAKDSCVEVSDELRKFIPVSYHPKHTGTQPQVNVIKPLQQVVSEVLKSDLSLFKDSELFLPDVAIEEIVRKCILQPNFPEYVGKVADILKKIEGE